MKKFINLNQDDTLTLFQNFVYFLILLVLLSFEASFGLPWLSIYFFYQVAMRLNIIGFWTLLLSFSLLISIAYPLSIFVSFGLLIILWWAKQYFSRTKWFGLYILNITAMAWLGTNLQLWLVIWQSILSLIFLFIHLRGVIWWPRTWKNNEKIY